MNSIFIKPIDTVEKYVKKELVSQKNPNFFKKQLASRCVRLLLVPISFTAISLEIITGFGLVLSSLCPLGDHRKRFNNGHRCIYQSTFLLTTPYKYLLRVIDPDLRVTKNKTIERKKTGILRKYFSSHFVKSAKDLKGSDNFLKKQVIARLFFGLAGTTRIIETIPDLIVAPPLAAACLLMGRKSKSFKRLTMQILKFPKIVNHLFVYTVGFVNPNLVQ